MAVMPKIGDWVQITGVMEDDPNPMNVGDQGQVTRVVSQGQDRFQVAVNWVNARTLMLIESDPFKVVPAPELFVQTPKCMVCQRTSTVGINPLEYAALQRGELVQNALPDRDAAFRELFIVGIHEHCGFPIFSGPSDE